MKMPRLMGLLLLAGLSGSGARLAGAAPGDRSRPAPASRPAAASRPTSASRPSHEGNGSAVSRPAGAGSREARPAGGGEHGVGRPAGGHLPAGGSRPAGRPEEPVSRPGSGGQLPSMSGPRPATRPAGRPEIPAGRPELPQTKPAPRPQPGGDDFLGLRPDRPTTLPAGPNGLRPDRPTTLPAGPNGLRPDRPTTLPGGGGVPLQPGAGGWNRPGQGNYRPQPAQRPTTLPGNSGFNRPVETARPDWGDRWNQADKSFVNQYSSWQQNNNIVVNNFQSTRVTQWNHIEQRYGGSGWQGRYGTREYNDWRRDVVAYRGGRCQEIWGRSYGYHNAFFNVGWWGACWWRPVAVVPVVRPVLSPWWWWRPVTWVSMEAFFGVARAVEPVIYDPGTTVIIEGNTVYIDGERAGDAAVYRRNAMALAAPKLEEIPLPEPPAVEGEVGGWLPLGVWALTQQEEGDAVMFFQLSVDRKGIVAGAYKNVMTGEDQPVIGQLDQAKQRLAWHLGDNTETVYETGLSGLTYDAASVFVHFGERQTQTWLLVRLPSPEMPPGSVKLPEIKNPAPRK